MKKKGTSSQAKDEQLKGHRSDEKPETAAENLLSQVEDQSAAEPETAEEDLLFQLEDQSTTEPETAAEDLLSELEDQSTAEPETAEEDLLSELEDQSTAEPETAAEDLLSQLEDQPAAETEEAGLPSQPEIETPPAPELPQTWDQETESLPEVIFRQELPRKTWTKYFWGLDVGSHTVKLVGIQKKLKKLSLTHLCIVEISPQKELSKDAESQETLSNAVLKALEGLDLERNSMISAVDNSAVVIRQIEYPANARQKLLSALHWETRKYIPFKPDEVVVDAQILNDGEESSQMSVLLTAVPKEQLNAHLRVLDKAGVKPLTVDAGQLAVLNTFLALNNLQPEETIVLLDMGANASYLTIYGNRGPFFTLSLSVGGNRFTREIQSRCQSGYSEAESLKCKRGGAEDQYVDSDTYYPLHEALQNTYELLISEIRQALVYYNKQTGINKFDRVILAGGGSALPEFPDYLSRKLGITVEVLNPLKDFEINPTAFDLEEVKKRAPQLTLAIGLAMRGAGL